ncbi:MAG: hypothetical protein D6795_17495, partial [Deltaproteobacteria bacterium]
NESQSRGGVNYVVLLMILLLAFVLGTAYLFVPPYYDNFLLERAFNQQAILAWKYTDEQIYHNVENAIEEIGVPLNPADVEILRSGGVIRIAAEYVVTVPWIDYDLTLTAKVERPITPPK